MLPHAGYWFCHLLELRMAIEVVQSERIDLSRAWSAVHLGHADFIDTMFLQIIPLTHGLILGDLEAQMQNQSYSYYLSDWTQVDYE